MNINDHQLDLILNFKSISNNKNNNINDINNKNKYQKKEIYTLILDLAKIFSIETKLKWEQLEYLSLRNSLIKNIDFIINMPNLFYLDIFQNPIETYKPFLISNSFGYLCFSPPLNYFEQKILTIEKLNVIFLIADIRDFSIKKNFLRKNPNIMVLNNEIIEYKYKLQLYSINQETSNYSLISSEDEKNSIFFDKNYSQKDKFLEHKFNVKKKEGCTNNKILEIEKFIKDYNNRILYYNKNGKQNYNQLKVNLEEKKKLIAICDCYLNILTLTNIDNHYYKYFPIKEKIDKKIIELSSVKHHKINILIFKHFKVTSLKEFLLSVLILHIFKILSKDISFELLKLILLKSNYYEENIERKKNLDNDIINILNLDPNLLICLYYKIYDIMFGIYSDKKLTDIQLKLQMNDITDKVMSVIQHQNNFIKLMKNNSESYKKGKIITQELIIYLNQNNIFNNILKIIQYVYDYIIYNSIQKELALKNSKDLQFFVDIKNYMYYSIDKKQADIQSMAEKNYNKIQIKSLFNNKYFFDTENYMKTTQYFMNVFLNYKHGKFYPDKNKIKNFKNEEEIINKENEEIKKLYVQNNLKSFFNIIKEEKEKKLNKPKNLIKSKFFRDKIYNNNKNLKTISNFEYYSPIRIKNKNNSVNIRKMDNTTFQLVKKSPDNFSNFKTANNFNRIISKKNRIFFNTEKSNFSNKIHNTESNTNYNKVISSPFNTEINIKNNSNISTSNSLYRTDYNDYNIKIIDNNKLEYLKFNSMSEVLNNNIDLTDKEVIKKLKNKLIKKKNFNILNQKKQDSKTISLKNIKLKDKYKSICRNIPKLNKEFYYNKALGCRINLKKLILGEENTGNNEVSFSKRKYKLGINISKI